ncbi:hypothetical protein [Pedobacter endophyticus]|uniref:Uncharacterized protein n=1 Tax=Pedobacter endophyticus TaxID=2789740 RepID=A0A7U3Q4P2_9SPHI|nr:hypothetical protein [Pedobacter endophyticus]QPH38529.1 hypothetical protein IZT61_15755 [Pedobacter endophyticus]
MRNIFLIITLSFISGAAFAQDTIAHDLRKLAHLKLWCEVHGVFPNQKEFSDRKKDRGRDSLFYQYVSLIAKVKKSPKIYLTYINKVLKENTDSLRKQEMVYKIPFPPTPLYYYNSYSIKIIDLYRVIKYSLLERDDDYLPENFVDLGVIDPKNYHGYYEPEPKREAAIKYIIKRFSLNAKEKKFLRDELNVGYVMDIKNFLDTCAQTAENELFIRESIASFVKDKEVPLDGLYFYHRHLKDTEGYMPRDKEPRK